MYYWNSSVTASGATCRSLLCFPLLYKQADGIELVLTHSHSRGDERRKTRAWLESVWLAAADRHLPEIGGRSTDDHMAFLERVRGPSGWPRQNSCDLSGGVLLATSVETRPLGSSAVSQGRSSLRETWQTACWYRQMRWADSLGEESLTKMKDEGIICHGESCFIMSFSLWWGFWPGNVKKKKKRWNCSVSCKNICRHCEAKQSADF